MNRLSGDFGNTWNTYVNHPPPFWLDYTSVDMWGEHGRGHLVGDWRGGALFYAIYNDPNPPWIRWAIWQGWIWIDGIGWRWHSADESWSDAGHFRHVHITFW